MKVVLRADVADVGKKGDIVEVADGFARNYLVPEGLAFKATDGATAQASVDASGARPPATPRPVGAPRRSPRCSCPR